MADILQQAGFRGKALDLARAIMMAESGGRAGAHNTNAGTGDNSYGLFQINMLGALGPDRLRRYGLRSNDQLFDPLTNARIAYQMSKGGTDWSPWSTYKSGAYEKYLGKGAKLDARQASSVAPDGHALVQAALGSSKQGAALTKLLSGLTRYASKGDSQENWGFNALGATLAQIQATREAQQLGINITPQSAAGPAAGPQVAPNPRAHGLATVGSLGTREGIAVNAKVLPEVTKIAQSFGVRVNSGYRSPEHNKAVGGAEHSDHLGGNAVDFVGPPEAMRKLYQWAQGRFPYVEPWDQAKGNHVHISFIR